MTLPQLFIWANKMDGEEFLPVPGYEGRFWISCFSRIVSYNQRNNSVKFLRPYLDCLGYRNTQLRMKPRNRMVRVHTLTAEIFCEGKSDIKNWVNHIDGIKLNNHHSNLEWVTPKGNCDHALTTGLHDLKGEKHPMSKLNNEQVLEIRELRKTGLSHQAIADKFSICRRQAGDIINRKNWGWLA